MPNHHGRCPWSIARDEAYWIANHREGRPRTCFFRLEAMGTEQEQALCHALGVRRRYVAYSDLSPWRARPEGPACMRCTAARSDGANLRRKSGRVEDGCRRRPPRNDMVFFPCGPATQRKSRLIKQLAWMARWTKRLIAPTGRVARSDHVLKPRGKYLQRRPRANCLAAHRLSEGQTPRNARMQPIRRAGIESACRIRAS